MAYRLFDRNNIEVNYHDLQDKGPWCLAGASKEEVFISRHGNGLGLIINPEKQSNPYAPDLLNINNRKLGDLKTQNTPFFQAESSYGLDPQYAVTFNQKDFERYRNNYPEIEIYFWVEWLVTGFEKDNRRIQVHAMHAVYKIEFADLAGIIPASPLHYYGRRFGDQRGNARASFVLNLNNPQFQRLL